MTSQRCPSDKQACKFYPSLIMFEPYKKINKQTRGEAKEWYKCHCRCVFWHDLQANFKIFKTVKTFFEAKFQSLDLCHFQIKYGVWMFLQSISVFIYILKIMAFCEFIISSCKQAKESCPSVFFFFFWNWTISYFNRAWWVKSRNYKAMKKGSATAG